LDGTVSLVLSLLALAVSATTAWLTLLRRATVKMTQPTTIYFGPDSSRSGNEVRSKVYLRTLLYATAKRGCIIESMFVRLSRGESTQAFNVWVYGDDRLKRGSGLFIPESGITTNHHFLLPFDESEYVFPPGDYRLSVFVSVVGERATRLLGSFHLSVTPTEAEALAKPEHGLYFDWSPDATDYRAHVRVLGRDQETPNMLRELFA